MAAAAVPAVAVPAVCRMENMVDRSVATIAIVRYSSSFVAPFLVGCPLATSSRRSELMTFTYYCVVLHKIKNYFFFTDMDERP
jgi:hypothetical protein